MAKIYNKGGVEKTIINSVREIFYRPFEAEDWTDLRVGFFVSICDATADDTITVLAENIADSGVGLPWTDRYALGITDRSSGTTFCGFTNQGRQQRGNSPWITLGDSELLSSNSGIGTSPADYWRARNSLAIYDVVQIIDGGLQRAVSTYGAEWRMVQDYSVGHADGYAALLMLRFTRADATGRSKIITMSFKSTGASHSGDILFSSDPSADRLIANLESFPTDIQTLGPIELNQTPDTFYMYWPFRNSRLRIHSHGILKVA